MNLYITETEKIYLIETLLSFLREQGTHKEVYGELSKEHREAVNSILDQLHEDTRIKYEKYRTYKVDL